LAKPAFLTFSSDDASYKGMVSDTRDRHLAYCERHGYEYIYREIPNDPRIAWRRIEMILQCLNEGYTHVFNIDADTMVVDFSRDLRDALPDWSFLAMTIHPYPMEKTIWHFQAGLFFVRNCDKARSFFEMVLAKDGQEPHDQAAINAILLDEYGWQQGLNILTHHWNASVHNQPQEGAIIAAWHGAASPPERRAWMQRYAQANPYK
jgi:Nucleotide-diphospho-sugar transferase